MTIGANTYGTVAGVQKLIGDVVANRLFTTATIPSLTTVQELLDQVASEINVHLKANGYTVPVAVSTDPEARDFLIQANNAGAAAILLATGPTEAWSQPDTENPSQGRRHQFENLLKRAIEMIDKRTLPAARSSSGFEEIIVGSKLDGDGNVNLPLFTRSLHDYPGSRNLTEAE